MTKIKVFKFSYYENAEDIEKTVNQWLEMQNGNINVIDIKVSMAGNAGGSMDVNYTIVYKK